MTKAELVSAIQIAREALIQTYAQIPVEYHQVVILYDTWSLKDLLAHFLGWEQRAQNILQAALHDEISLAVEEDGEVDAINARFYKLYKDMPYEDVALEEQDLYDALIALIEGVEDEDLLFNVGRFPWLQARSVADWLLLNTATHYATHLADLQGWLKSQVFYESPSESLQLLANIRAGQAQLEAMFARIPADKLETVALYGHWTPKDLLAHLGWWTRHSAMLYAMLKLKIAPDRALMERIFSESGFDVVNARIYEDNLKRPLDKIRAEQGDANEAILRIVEQGKPAEFFDKGHFAFMNGRALLGWMTHGTYLHYHTHLSDLEAWLRANNW
jgi:hypothetical protein